MKPHDKKADRFADIREFYNSVYYKSAGPVAKPSRHYRQLALKIGIREQEQVLDVACGCGQWLLACRELGASVNGVDLSANAIAVCKAAISQGEFQAVPAEALPFEDNTFDVVTCLGALEHFVDPGRALREMVRVARQDARFLLLVPNADFLTRRLRLYAGTHQVDAREEVKTLDAWKLLFEVSGLTTEDRWRDLHVLSWSWISAEAWYSVPVRAAQALALCFWPLKWQYQVYHLCKLRRP